ncbi:hypothetical protein V1293_002925 [Bradyrhizobium sp. AZCC 1693]
MTTSDATINLLGEFEISDDVAFVRLGRDQP